MEEEKKQLEDDFNEIRDMQRTQELKKIEEEKIQEVKRDEVKEKKNHPMFVSILVILLLGVFTCMGFFGGIYYHKNSIENKSSSSEKKKDENQKIDEKETKEEPFQNLSLEDPMVLLVSKLNPKYLCGQTSLELVQQNRTVQEISSIEKMRMLESYYRSETPLEKTRNASVDEVKKFFEDISFLEKYTNGIPKDEDLGYVYYDDIRYNNNQLVFNFTLPGGCEGPSQGSFLRLFSAKKNSKKLYVNYLLDYEDADRVDENTYNFIYKYYKDSTKAEYIGEGEDVSELDASLFSGYQFVFNIENGNYWLEGINYLPKVNEG